MASFLANSSLFRGATERKQSLVRAEILDLNTWEALVHSDDAKILLADPQFLEANKIIEGAWILVRSQFSESMVYVHGCSLEDAGVVRISSLLAFNLQLEPHPQLSIEICLGETTWSYFDPIKMSLHVDRPPIASSITIARVKCPESSGHADYSKEIRRHFENTIRVVRIGDVFPVAVDEDSCSSSQTTPPIAKKDESNNENKIAIPSRTVDLFDFGIKSHGEIPRPTKYVFFKVTNVQVDHERPRDYRDDVTVNPTGDTMLKQVGGIHSRVPDIFYSPEDSVDPRLVQILRPSLVSGNLLKDTARPDVALLLCGPRGSGKRKSVRALARRCNVHVKSVSLTSARGLPQDKVIPILEEAFFDASQVVPCVLILTNLESLTPLGTAGKEKPDDPDQVAIALRKLIRSKKQPVVGISVRLDEVHPVIRGCFTHELEFSAPDRSKRKELLSTLIEKVHVDDSVDVEDLASKTAGRTATDLAAVISEAGHSAVLKKTPSIGMRELEKAIDELPGAMDELSTAAPKIPEVYWDDVGGLMHAKDEILDMVQLPLKRPDLFASGLKSRSGILLFGPPGTGKTLLAKAVATECAMNFISVKGPELLDMYIGESERKVREVFETARAARPCVLFFDELDSLAPQRGRGSDSGGVMDRVVSQLLTEIDGMQKGSGDVFVIGATNRPDLLDSSLLRPGRFDRLIYLGICQDRTEQLKIVAALTRKYLHESDVDLMRVLENAPLNLTGADFYALCSEAMSNALKRRVAELGARASALGMTPRKLLASLKPEELQVRVGMQDYLAAMAGLVPSVSELELKHYEKLRDKFANKDVKAMKKLENGTAEHEAGSEANGNGLNVDETLVYGQYRNLGEEQKVFEASDLNGVEREDDGATVNEHHHHHIEEAETSFALD